LLELAERQRGYDYVRAVRQREEVAQRVDAAFTHADYLLLPTLPVTPPRRDAATVTIGGAEHDFTLALIRYTCLFDHTGNPVVSLPSSQLSPGIGTSIQLVGARNADAGLVAFAEQVEAALDLRVDRSLSSAGLSA
jgi:Asp-tRNA(Asn)/Glu-tRNA(Gln) amidotransferase A subunit family amidase